MSKTRAPAPVFTDRPTDWALLPVTLNTTEVCNLLLCGAEKATSLVKEGKIRGVDNGNGYLFDRDSVRAYLGGNLHAELTLLEHAAPMAAKALDLIRQFGDSALALYREMEPQEARKPPIG